jgi:hypothetical protein
VTPVDQGSESTPAFVQALTDNLQALELGASRLRPSGFTVTASLGSAGGVSGSATSTVSTSTGRIGQLSSAGQASVGLQVGSQAATPLLGAGLAARQHATNAIPADATSLPSPTVTQIGARLQSGNAAVFSEPIAAGPLVNTGTLTFSSFLGSPGEGGLVGTALDSSGNIYVTGYSDPGTGKVGGFIAKLDSAATTVLWADAINGTSATGRDEAHGIAINSNGVYVVGSLSNDLNPTNAPTDGFVLQLDPATGNQIGSGVSFAQANLEGVALDSSGNVYVSGSVGSNPLTGVPGQDMAIAKFDQNLDLPPIYAVSFHFSVGTPPVDADTLATSSQSIAVDSAGNAYIVGALRPQGDANMDSRGFWMRLNADGATLPYAFFLNNGEADLPLFPPTPGPNGGLTGITSDANFIYFTGSNNDNATAGNPLNQDLWLGKAPLATGNPGDPGGYLFVWYADNRVGPTFPRAGDWQGDAIRVLPNGSTIVAGAAFDPSAHVTGNTDTKGVDVTVTHFDATGGNTTQNPDGDPENTFGGTLTDGARGMVLASSSAPIVVGVTNSTDFPTTSGVFQTTYGGGSTDGFVSKLSGV